MRSEGFFTYSRSAYTNFLHEERKLRRLFFARRAYSTHFTHRVEKKELRKNKEKKKNKKINLADHIYWSIDTCQMTFS